ncbi:MAG TPA: acyl-CoA carboxylase subunit epsilon [Pilimelia sp.]|nr:acyl-CoA carboxylase subunit epsilon [Pilimelia sp.]
MAENERPFFRIVRGTPTPEELAALVGVVISRSRPVAAQARRSAGPAWVNRARPGAIEPSGLPARPGPGAWRASGLPR